MKANFLNFRIGFFVLGFQKREKFRRYSHMKKALIIIPIVIIVAAATVLGLFAAGIIPDPYFG